VVDALHADQLRQHGGLPGVRDENALESALGRPRQKWSYGERDMSMLAAAYGFGFTKNHAYRDGNKRIGFLTLATFLGINDLELDVSDEEIVTAIVSVAAGHTSEEDLAAWIRAHVRRVTDG
jgi:death-on-curing protein